MGALSDRLAEDLKDAMRAGDAVRRDELRGLLAALRAENQTKLTRDLDRAGLLVRDESATLSAEQQAAIERTRATAALGEDDEQRILLQRVKQHQQSIDGFRQGKREDLVAIEEAQLKVLRQYLPAAVGEGAVVEAVQAAIAETGALSARDQGKVMALLSQRLRGRADMKQVSALVKARLAGPN